MHRIAVSYRCDRRLFQASLLLLAGAVPGSSPNPAEGFATTAPITHLVVIFDEHVSFDHSFATYPMVANEPGEPVFAAAPDAPSVNGLSPALLTRNPHRPSRSASTATTR